MEAKDPIVVDLFHGNYTGTLDGWKKTDLGHKPVIRPFVEGLKAFLPFIFSRPKEFEWQIDKKENMEYIASENKAYLIPTRDIQGLNYETTIWYDLQTRIESSGSEYKEELEKMKKENGKLKRKLRNLKEEEEEKEKREAKTRQGGGRVMACSAGHSIRTKRKEGDPCPDPNCSGFLEGVAKNEY